MTKIEYCNSIRGFYFSAKGHAEYAESGKDIVCAGISAYTSAILIACEKAANKGLIRNWRHKEENGEIEICFRYTKLGFLPETIELLIECLQEIEIQNPAHLQITKLSEAEIAEKEYSFKI